jgi:hypothetical protein
VHDPINYGDYSGNWGVPTWVKWVAAAVAVVAVVVIVVVAAAIIIPAVAAAVVAATGISIGVGAALAIGAAAGAIGAAAASVAIRGKIDRKTAAFGLGGAVVGATVVGLALLTAQSAGVCALACLKAPDIVSNEFKSTMTLGQQAHRVFSSMMEEAGNVANKAVFKGSNLRPDGFNEETKTIFELKPANFAGVSNGLSQLSGYNNVAGGGYNTQLWLYNINPDGTFNYFQYTGQ